MKQINVACTDIDDDLLLGLVQHLPNVESIDIRGCPHLSDQLLATLKQTHPNIIVISNPNILIKPLTCVNTLTRHTESVSCMISLPNGIIVSGSYDKTMKIWDTSSGKCVYPYWT